MPGKVGVNIRGVGLDLTQCLFGSFKKVPDRSPGLFQIGLPVVAPPVAQRMVGKEWCRRGKRSGELLLIRVAGFAPPLL